jgi:hypothetical protein
MIWDCGLRIAECRRHRAEGIGHGERRQWTEGKTAGSGQLADDRGKMISDCGMRIAECRRHRAEGIGKDDRGQRERSRRSEVRDQRTEGRL